MILIGLVQIRLVSFLKKKHNEVTIFYFTLKISIMLNKMKWQVLKFDKIIMFVFFWSIIFFVFQSCYSVRRPNGTNSIMAQSFFFKQTLILKRAMLMTKKKRRAMLFGPKKIEQCYLLRILPCKKGYEMILTTHCAL